SWRVRIQEPESPMLGSRRMPTSGALGPVATRQTMCAPWTRAIAAPVAPLARQASSNIRLRRELSTISFAISLGIASGAKPENPIEFDSVTNILLHATAASKRGFCSPLYLEVAGFVPKQGTYKSLQWKCLGLSTGIWEDLWCN